MKKITVDIINHRKIEVEKNTKLKDLIKLINKAEHKNYLCGRINNEIKHLDYELDKNTTVEFLDIKNNDGLRVYRRTLSYIFLKAVKDLYEDSRVSIEHSLSKGLYVEIDFDKELTPDDTKKIKSKMEEIIIEDVPIERLLMDTDKADKIFKKQGMNDKLRLSKYRNKEKIHVYNLDGFYDKFYGYLAPSTGYIKEFDLKFYHPGIIIQYPRKEYNFKIPEFKEQNKLAKVFKESEEWGEILDVADVGALNDKIREGSIEEIIRISEALHEKKIAYIADKISEDNDIKIILIAGPSSSGKTTFAHRLYTQLRVNGKFPISLSIDDYFVNREDTPVDENGEYDFESIDAVDIKKFNDDLIKLMDGKKVNLPKYNFIKGKREIKIKDFSITEDQPIIIEGIHGLNEKLTREIPQRYKFKIYVSALTQLNIDKHNRIPTTDNRLIRRIVRDSKYRGNDAKRTLELWSSVRRGETRNIFPFQEEADAMFNSALVYELAILRKYAEPLLEEIDRTSIHFAEAKRLLKFMSYFKNINNNDIIPNTSILKEFIGGSCFREEE